MGLAKIQDDSYLSKIRTLCAEKSGQELEFALTVNDPNITDQFFPRTVNYYLDMVPWIEEAFPLRGQTLLRLAAGPALAH